MLSPLMWAIRPTVRKGLDTLLESIMTCSKCSIDQPHFPERAGMILRGGSGRWQKYTKCGRRRRNWNEGKNLKRASARYKLRNVKICAVCGATEKLTVDHILPLNKGGSNDRFNLQKLCRACHDLKDNVHTK